MSQTSPNEVLQTYCHTRADGSHQLLFRVEGVHCAACMARLEGAMSPVKGVASARLNLTTKRLTLTWQGPLAVAQAAIAQAHKAGYGLTPYAAEEENPQSQEEKQLLRCLAVAGFASMNVMLLSVSMWSGAADETRQLFQWLSALIALPAVAYAGRPYFFAAWQALRHRRMAMEIPISVALVLTTAISLFDTATAHGETWFESAVMLLFFLLLGRYLEARVRGRSRNAAEHLLGLQHTFVACLDDKGKVHLTPSHKVLPGSTVLWRQGERLGVDGVLAAATSADTSVLTGETVPRLLKARDVANAGLINRGAAVRLTVTASGQATVLAELARLTEAATTVKNSYTRLADRVSRAYAPVVHLLALLTFVGWLWAGLGWHSSLLRAAAVLIVTCPCALALAVPTVQVAIMGRLLRQGIILKNGTALERLSHVSAAVLDKTGTLTYGTPKLVAGGTAAQRKLAARMAIHSQHPLSVALAHHGPATRPLAKVKEVAGEGLTAHHKGQLLKLGSARLCGVAKPPPLPTGQADAWFKMGQQKPVRFIFQDVLRPDAKKALQSLARQGLALHLVSGDTPQATQHLAHQLAIGQASGGVSPKGKQKILTDLAAQGHTVMMVGDGLNDAPSLALAPVGVSFGKATDLAKLAADVILQRESLASLTHLVQLARAARRATWSNVGFALAYNAFTIPLAMAGYITPALAALAMSSSSLVVSLNAARFARGSGGQKG